LPKEKIILVDVEKVKSTTLQNILLPQKVKSTLLVYIGMDKKGMVFLSLNYQMKILSVPISEKRVLDVCINELRKLFNVI